MPICKWHRDHRKPREPVNAANLGTRTQVFQVSSRSANYPTQPTQLGRPTNGSEELHIVKIITLPKAKVEWSIFDWFRHSSTRLMMLVMQMRGDEYELQSLFN